VKVCIIALVLLSKPCLANEAPPECRYFTEHKPAPDVAYQPGMGVHGKPVVPADLNAAPMGLEKQNIVIPLTVDFAERLNIQSANLEGTLGFIEVTPEGRVTYNGQDLTPQAYAVCGQKTAPAPDGQTAPDPLK
jgi:hypothetical protein